MSTAGDYVGEEVWHRIVQIVTNTEELQEYAARKVYEYLRNPACHETIVKVGAYILGEYGHLIAAEDDSNAISPIEQFSLINSKISICSPATKALILTTYAKWLNLFPEIREHVLAVLARFTHALDAELQQRACEYIAISKMPEEEELLQVALDEMPPFPEARESTLLNRLMKKHMGSGGEKRTWAPGGKEVNKDMDEERYKGFGARRKAAPVQAKEVGDTALQNGNGAHQTGPTPEDAALIAMAGSGAGEAYIAPDDIMAGLAGLDLSGQVPLNSSAQIESPVNNTASTPGLMESVTTASASPQAPLIANEASDEVAQARSRANSSLNDVATSNTPAALPPDIQYTHGHEKWLSRLVYNSEGILYEDSQLQIGLKSEYHAHEGRIALYFGNKISVPFSSLTVTIESLTPDTLTCNLQKIPPATLNAATQIQQVVTLECKAFFDQCPVLRVSYLAGSMQTLTLKLPVWVNKFMETAQLDTQAFFDRWKAIGGPPREAQVIFPCRLSSSGDVDVSRNKKVIKGLRFGVLENVDPNPNNVVAASVFYTTTGKVGCLLRLEPNSAAKVSLSFLGGGFVHGR